MTTTRSQIESVSSRWVTTIAVRSLGELGKRFADQAFAFEVHLACCFVEDQEFRIAQQRSSHRDPLALAAGEVVPPCPTSAS